jgi:manganese/iron transport system permease protein
MIDTLLEPFTYQYMVNAMWAWPWWGSVRFSVGLPDAEGLVADRRCAVPSIVPGVAGAYMLGLPFAIGAFLAGGLAAAAMLFLNQRTKLREDAIIGLIFTSFFALGLFMVSLNPTLGGRADHRAGQHPG